MKSLSKKYSIIALALICILISYLGITQPFKIVDPADSRFNPDKFKFSDYVDGPINLEQAYRTLFPLGTSKEFVDRVLVRAGGAISVKSKYDNGKIFWFYHQPRNSMKGSPKDIFLFDKKIKLKTFLLGGITQFILILQNLFLMIS